MREGLRKCLRTKNVNEFAAFCAIGAIGPTLAGQLQLTRPGGSCSIWKGTQTGGGKLTQGEPRNFGEWLDYLTTYKRAKAMLEGAVIAYLAVKSAEAGPRGLNPSEKVLEEALEASRKVNR